MRQNSAITQWNSPSHEHRGARADEDRRERERQRAQPRGARSSRARSPSRCAADRAIRAPSAGCRAGAACEDRDACASCWGCLPRGRILRPCRAACRRPQSARAPWHAPPEAENGGMLTIGSIVLTVEDITRAGDFWRAALGYVNRRPPSEDWVILDPPYKKRWDAPGASLALSVTGYPQHYPPRIHLDLYAEDQAAEIAAAEGARRARAWTGTATPTTRTGSCSKTPRATGSASSTPVRRRPPDRRPRLSAARRRPRGSSRGRACRSAASRGRRRARAATGGRARRSARTTAARASSSCTDSLRRSASPRGTTTTDASPQRSIRDPDDDGRLETGDRAHDPFDAVERHVHAARDDDVVDAAPHAQEVVLDDPGVAGAVPPACRRRRGGTRHPSPPSRRGSPPRASGPRSAPRRR